MRTNLLISYLLILLSGQCFAQTTGNSVPDPKKSDFIGELGFLSSDWMEGREAGTRGSFMAADYIRSRMMQLGLKPVAGKDDKKPYFQDFDIIRYKTVSAELGLVTQTGHGQIQENFRYGIDFVTEAGPAGIQATAPVRFVGYGISAPLLGYDDYKKTDVRDCIVVMMAGFPGAHDTLSEGWKKFGHGDMERYRDIATRKQTAFKKGALAILLVSPHNGSGFQPGPQANLNEVKSSVSLFGREDPVYEDDNYALVFDSVSLPVFTLGTAATARLLAGTGINLQEAERMAASKLLSQAAEIAGKMVNLTVEVKAEALLVRNVLGYIPGVDTTKTIVIGAHYDHLGTRNGLIYNGADDNASGVAGMLAIAGVWSRSGIKPGCNMIFAAWAAEEKGLLGSSWFVNHFDDSRQSIRLNVNFDMISRSDPNDTAGKIISIGFLRGTDNLKSMAASLNGNLHRPFELDLWETTGHGGSDYAPFAMRKIPVMSFFSGYHNDYHSPRDIFAQSDSVKMEAILKLANDIIREFIFPVQHR